MTFDTNVFSNQTVSALRLMFNFYASNLVVTNLTTVTNFLTFTNVTTNGGALSASTNTNAVSNSAALTNFQGTNYAGGALWTNTAGQVFNGIPAGSNLMGDTVTYTNQHWVTLTAFHMSRFETTYRAWTNVYNWAILNGYGFDSPGLLGYMPAGSPLTMNPVVSNNWYDMVKWCNALSEKEGRTPCYYLDSGFTTVYRTTSSNIINTMVNWNANGYRLPTEAEWEYACRAGTINSNYWGDSMASATNYAWYSVNSPNKTQTVGQKLPNSWELYDMIGDVWEWLWDYFSPYAGTNETDPHGPSIGSERVAHGFSWYENFGICSFHRENWDPTIPDNATGFRIVTRSSN